LDAFLPAYDVWEHHQVSVRAEPIAAYRAMETVRLSDSWVVSALLRLRGLKAPRTTLAAGLRSRFVVLREEPGREVVFGLAGRFWRPRGNIRDLDSAAAFESFEESGFAKTAWNFVFTGETGGTRISTETRVRCFGAASRMKFRAYWTLVGPFSGLIRMEMLRLIKRRAESAEAERS
jgi:hypothetical protein